MSKEWRMFILGVAWHAATMMFYQDWHGLEGYIEQVRARWVEIPPAVGFMLIIGTAWMAWEEAKR